jgi:hypothetical protein
VFSTRTGNQRAIEIPTDRLEELRERLKRNCVVMPSGCWEWKLARNPLGYGQTTCGDIRGGAHRLSYAAFKAPIPAGIDVLHSCDNPPCINPDHLSLGTDKENVKERHEKGRYWTDKRLSNSDLIRLPFCRKRGHSMEGKNILIGKNGRRRCRACHAINNKKSIQRRKLRCAVT